MSGAGDPPAGRGGGDAPASGDSNAGFTSNDPVAAMAAAIRAQREAQEQAARALARLAPAVPPCGYQRSTFSRDPVTGSIQAAMTFVDVSTVHDWRRLRDGAEPREPREPERPGTSFGRRRTDLHPFSLPVQCSRRGRATDRGRRP